MKLYFLSISDLVLLIMSILLDGYLKTSGLVVGILVGILTLVKLWQDIKLKKLERKIKERELDKWGK